MCPIFADGQQRTVYLWADNDDAGTTHMDAIAARLFKLGADDIRSVNWGDAPHKGDAADFTGDHTALMKLLETATSIEKAAIEADDGDEKQKQSTLLINLAKQSGAEFFHTPEKEPFATFRVAQHFEISSLKDSLFRLWLDKLFYEDQRQAISSNAMQEALSIFRALALFDGKTARVYLRQAHVDGRIYVDVCDDEWRVID